MPKSIESFVAGLERSLQQRTGTGGGPAATRRKLARVVEQCGWTKRSHPRLSSLEEALSDAGIYADQNLGDLNLGLDTTVRFSYQPPEVLSKVFRQERALGYHLGKYKEALEEALPRYAPLEHLSGGNKKERGYSYQGTQVRPDLVFKAKSGDWLVCEIERGDPKYESVTQLDLYMKALASRGRDVVGVLVTAKPRSTGLRDQIVAELNRINDRGNRAVWLWYSVSIELDLYQPK